jgi:hypothetical protein
MWLGRADDERGRTIVEHHGKHTLPKAFVTNRCLAMRATTDHSIDGSVGDPLLVLTVEASVGLTKMLSS